MEEFTVKVEDEKIKIIQSPKLGKKDTIIIAPEQIDLLIKLLQDAQKNLEGSRKTDWPKFKA